MERNIWGVCFFCAEVRVHANGGAVADVCDVRRPEIRFLW